MTSFEELGLSPELVVALAAEGIETPNALQREALPVLRKGHSALLRGGPGSGVLMAWGAALLDRLEPAPGGPVGLVLVSSTESAVACAQSLGRVAAAAGHRVAALGGPFALPGHADLLFATPGSLLAAGDEVATDGVLAFVISGAAALLEDGSEALAAVVERVPAEAQRVVVSDPVTPAVRAFAEQHLKRAIHLPSDAGRGADAAPVQRGELRLRVLEGDEGAELARVAGELLESGETRHLLLFFRSEDRAADLGDLLTLHGYAAGGPGDEASPVWLAVDGIEARRAIEGAEGVSVVSVDVPTDADELDRRHGGASAAGVIMARAREAAHLRRIALEAGYGLVPFPVPTEAASASVRFREALAPIIEEEDLEPYHLLVEGAIERWGSSEVAAALALLLRRKGRLPGGPAGSGRAGSTPSSPAGEGAPVPFVRLFLSIGSRDGVGPGELLGAITGESGVRGDQVGRIDVRDTFSRVEVQEPVAATIIQALNGTSIRGRSVRADYDRGGDRTPGRDGGKAGGDRSGRGGDRPPSRGDRPAGRGGSRPDRKPGGSGRPPGRKGPPRD
jgi:ATP-dependent RNA helicase DeaD